MFERAHTCLAIAHVNITWLEDSPSNPHNWHLVSIFIPLATILSATGIAPLKNFQRKVLILGVVLRSQTWSFNSLKKEGPVHL